MTKRTCKDCQSENLVPRGGGYFRNRCHTCYARYQRELWQLNRDARLVVSKRNYAKHAAKRREEAAIHKAENREYYALAEWFRKRGIPISHIKRDDLVALIEMKKAIKSAKAHEHNTPS